MSDEKKFSSAPTFSEWFNQNHEEIRKMARSDLEDLLFEAWIGGYESGLNYMARKIS